MVGITGATGHLGNVVTRTLLEGGESVRCLVRSVDRFENMGLPSSSAIRGDLLDPSSLLRCFEGCTAVIHSAALVSVDENDSAQLARVNIEGTRNVIDACRTAGVRRLVAVGSVEAFDLTAGASQPDEYTRLDPERTILAYGKTKAHAINEVIDANGEGLETVVVSPTAMLGPWDYRPSPMGRFIRAFLKKRLPAYVHGGFDFVDVRDVSSACVAAIRAGRAGGHYAVSGRYVTVREMLEKLAAVSDIPMPRVCVPDAFALLFGVLSVWFSGVFKRSAIVTPEVVRLLSLDARISSAQAKADLGYAARDLEETLRDTVKWFREGTE